ncbi:MAG: type II toxin-antitoxin system RatA family toxin [Burkholderiales bacterium]
MPDVNKSALVSYSAQKIYGLVDRVEAYPEFLPWCGGTNVELRTQNMTRAEVRIDYHGIRQSFKTQNETTPYSLIHMRLVSGPFKHLEGYWRFHALAQDACKIEFRLHYEFSSRILEKLVGPVFSYIANSFVDAFLARAEKLYGR